MGRHKKRRVHEWMRAHYYLDQGGVWARIRARVERNGGIEGTKLDILALMVWVCAIAIAAITVWMIVSGTLLWP